VADQPAANGLVLITGYALAVILATTIDHPRWRALLWVIAAACGYGVYLTHTRSVYLAFVVVVIMGALLAKGRRRAFVTTGVVLIIGVALDWSTFSSADRDAGGVGSTNELYDRLNADTTAIWGFLERPWSGWGLGRFVSLNTYHHQRWSEDIPWIRGLGIAAHSNELGILAELGIVGLALWLGILFFVFRSLVMGVRTLPAARLLGRPLALTALMTMSALVTVGLFIDLRLLDYPSTAAFAFAGAAVGALDRFQNASNTRQYVRLPRLRF
jgi:O-antigen ligase